MGANRNSAVTNQTLIDLFQKGSREERLRRLPPERRAVYERIQKLRSELGPVALDIVKTVRELRRNG
jgi:hypothetical protein